MSHTASYGNEQIIFPGIVARVLLNLVSVTRPSLIAPFQLVSIHVASHGKTCPLTPYLVPVVLAIILGPCLLFCLWRNLGPLTSCYAHR